MLRASVTGWALHLPATSPAPAGVPDALRELAGPAVGADRASVLLGRKGLLGKEPATRLALCAVHRALGLPDGVRAKPVRDPGTAVVACSNLGNMGTVVDVARAVRAGGVREVSPMAAPNASSNVIASTVALWFGFGGPNLMVCSGATAGLDGLAVALRLLRAGRAERVVLVGAEPDDEVAAAVHRGSSPWPLRAGAACVILARAANGENPSVGLGESDRAADLVIGPDGFDPRAAWGDAYGAQGVISLALALGAVSTGRAAAVTVTCGDAHDGMRSAMVTGAVVHNPASADPVHEVDPGVGYPDTPSKLQLTPGSTWRGGGGGRVIRPLVDGAPGWPRIVLGHGLEDSWTSWRGLTEHCDPSWRVEALDLPWRAGNDYRWRSRDTAVGWLTRALDALDGPPDVFVGHSYAANAALELLASGGGTFGAVLVCPLYRPPSVDVTWKLFDASRVNFEAHMRESIRARMGRRRDLVPADVLDSMIEKALDRVGPNGLLAAFDRYVASGDIPLETIEAPIAILGGGSDLTLSVASAHALAARLPTASLTVGDDLDHFCHVRRPADVVAHIRDFVRAHAEREPAHIEGVR